MQQLGSSSTYVRRYALCAMLGIAAEEDDDGRQAAAVNPHGASAGVVPSTEESPFQPPDLPEDLAPEDLTAAQRRKIFAIRTKLIDAGIFSEEQFKAQMNMSYGVDSVSRADEGSGLGSDRAPAEGRGAACLESRTLASCETSSPTTTAGAPRGGGGSCSGCLRKTT